MGDGLTTLARQLRGELLLADDHGYDDAWRGFNSLHDRYPAVIVRPADGDDVATALAFATSAGLEIAVRSGGHSPQLPRRRGRTTPAPDLPDSTYRRLVDIKRRYDPNNLFHRNLNIRPA